MGHLLVVAKQRLVSQEIRNTFWFGGGDATMTNAQAIVDGIRAEWSAHISGSLADLWTLYAFDVYDKTIPGVPGIEYVPTAGTLTGGSASEPMATQVALLLTFKAQVAPPNTNRKYLGGYIESALADGLWPTAYTDNAVAFGEGIIDLGTTLTLGIAMEVVTLNADGTVAGGNPLEYCLGRAVPATQRRRRIGVGI